jgi:hypothetical protein
MGCLHEHHSSDGRRCGNAASKQGMVELGCD